MTVSNRKNRCIPYFVELHGGRYFCDDKAILGGIALATSDELIAKRYARFRKM